MVLHRRHGIPAVATGDYAPIPMKVWELIAKLEGADPEAELVVRDGAATLLVDDAVIEAPAEAARRVALFVSA